MSLNPEDSRRRGRSKSPGRRDDRDRSRSRVEDPRERSRTRPAIERAPSPPSSRYSPRYDDDRARDRDIPRYKPTEEIITKSSTRSGREPTNYYKDASPPSRRSKYEVPGSFDKVEDEVVRTKYVDRKQKDHYEERQKPTRRQYSSDDDSSPERPTQYKEEEKAGYLKYEADSPPYRDDSRGADRRKWEAEIEKRARAEYEKEKEQKLREREREAARKEYRPRPRSRSISPPSRYSSSPPAKGSGLAYGDSPPIPDSMRSSYAEPKKWEYAQPAEHLTYKPRNGPSSASDFGHSPRASQTQVPYGNISMPGGSSGYGASPRSSQSQMPYGTSSYGALPSTSQGKIVSVDPTQRRGPSNTDALAPHMSSLSVSTGHHSLSVHAGHGRAPSLSNVPGSPLLESYHGTYQSISPMPSPLMIASKPYSSNMDILEVGPLSPGRQRHARFHDPADDAAAIAKVLKGNKEPDTGPLIELLPPLTHDQVMELRVEYKKLVKTGSERKGVNIAKHIKLRLKEEDSSLMKACYAVALGKWESEAYWANFWYQGEKSRRELLIESLMGRTNAEIREIKDGFSDKKYSDSLTKCMKTELKEDKFKKAVLLVLEEKRMDDRPSYYPDRFLVEEDVKTLHKAVRSEKGGETAMIQIIVLRSDNHIREILRAYEDTYRTNFAREMLKKSGNLVVGLLCPVSIHTNVCRVNFLLIS